MLGLGFQAGRRQGMLLVIALAVEYLFLALSIASALDRTMSGFFIVCATVGISLAVPLGMLGAAPIGSLPATYMTVAYAFGLIAFLYLVTEELLARSP